MSLYCNTNYSISFARPNFISFHLRAQIWARKFISIVISFHLRAQISMQIRKIFHFPTTHAREKRSLTNPRAKKKEPLLALDMRWLDDPEVKHTGTQTVAGFCVTTRRRVLVAKTLLCSFVFSMVCPALRFYRDFCAFFRATFLYMF